MNWWLISFLMLFVTQIIFAKNEFYVSPKGNDTWEGSKEKPWRSFKRAVEGVRDYRLNNPEMLVNVLFSDGIYYLNETIILNKDDSGSDKAPIIYKADINAKPVFSGGVPLKKWKKVKNDRVLSLLNDDVKGRLYECKLPENFNENSLPAKIGVRVPLNNVMERIAGARTELICNNTFQTLSRYPNKGFMQISKVISQPDSEHPEIDINAKFTCSDNRMLRWTNESDVYLGGYWYWDWADEFQKVDRIEPSDSSLILSKPYHSYGYREGASFWAMNLFCELDSVSEYYIDRKQGKVYWIPEDSINLKASELSLTNFDSPYMVKFEDCSNVSLEGLTFRDGSTVGVGISGGNNITISSCRFLCFSESAVHIFDGYNHRISGCLMKQFGERVIQIYAGNRKKLIPANHIIDNNIISDFSIIKRTYEPAVYFNGIGLHISNNYFSNCPSSALRLDGNDVTVEYNEFVNLVRESDDQGVIDMWKDLSYQGIKICHNYFQDIKGGTLHGSAGVRFDDMISGAVVKGNIFNRVGYKNFGAIQIHGGKENIIENNLFYDCLASVSFSPWNEEQWKSVCESAPLMKKHYEDVDISSKLFLDKYPVLRDINSNINRNHISRNLMVRCKNPYLHENNNNDLDENYFIDNTSKPIEYFYQEEVLRQFGLDKLDRNKMGVKSNIWSK